MALDWFRFGWKPVLSFNMEAPSPNVMDLLRWSELGVPSMPGGWEVGMPTVAVHGSAHSTSAHSASAHSGCACLVPTVPVPVPTVCPQGGSSWRGGHQPSTSHEAESQMWQNRPDRPCRQDGCDKQWLLQRKWSRLNILTSLLKLKLKAVNVNPLFLLLIARLNWFKLFVNI